MALGSFMRGAMEGYDFADTAMRRGRRDKYEEEDRAYDMEKRDDERAIRGEMKKEPTLRDAAKPVTVESMAREERAAPADVQVTPTVPAPRVEQRPITYAPPEPSMRSAAPAVAMAPGGMQTLPHDTRAPQAPPQTLDIKPGTPPGPGPMQPLVDQTKDVGPAIAASAPAVPQPAAGEYAAKSAISPGALPVDAQRSATREMNARLMAGQQEAMRRGRWQDAIALQTQGRELRERLRMEEGDLYRQRYAATGDPNVWVPYVNEYIGDGTQLQRIEAAGEGKYRLVGTDGISGKPINRELSGEQLTKLLRNVQDPKTARALEAKSAEAMLEVWKQQQIEAGRHRFQTLAPGATLVDTATGQTFKAAGDDWKTTVVPQGEGQPSRVMAYNERTGKWAWLDQPEGGGAGDRLDKVQREQRDKAESAVLKAYGVDTFAKLDDNVRATAQEEARIAGELMTANAGTANERWLSPAAAADVARQVREGKAARERVRIPGTAETTEVVRLPDGRTLFTDPRVAQRVSQMQREAPPAGAQPGGAAPPTAPRGERNNNPLNIRPPGASTGFQQFSSAEEGIAAGAQLLGRYAQGGRDTIEKIIERWAPPSENDTKAYIAAVSKATGLAPGQRLDLSNPETLERLMTAMIQHENGRISYSPEQIRAGIRRGLAGRTDASPRMAMAGAPRS